MTDDPRLLSDVSDFDLDASTAQAWDGFAARLAEVISVMDAGASLSIGPIATSEEGEAPFVSFTCAEHGRLTAHAASNGRLAEDDQLGVAQLTRMDELGWRPPTTEGADASGDFQLNGTQEDSLALALAAVTVLRDVYGVAHPAFLEPDQLADILTAPPVEELPPPPTFDPAEIQPVVPRSRADLDAVIERELTALLGHEPVRDADGDFAIRVGSTVVFVRASQDAAEVLIFSVLVHDVDGRSRAMEVLSDLNTDARYVRFLLIRDRVFVSLSIFATPFVPAHLHQGLRIVSLMGDRIDGELAAKLRGRTTFSDDAGDPPA